MRMFSGLTYVQVKRVVSALISCDMTTIVRDGVLKIWKGMTHGAHLSMPLARKPGKLIRETQR